MSLSISKLLIRGTRFMAFLLFLHITTFNLIISRLLSKFIPRLLDRCYQFGPNFLVYSGISTRENAMKPVITSSWIPDWNLISQLAPTTATLWRDFDLDGGFVYHYRDRDLKEFHVKHLSAVDVLLCRGQVCQKIVNPSFHTEWLDVKRLKVMILDMYGRFYPQWCLHGRLQEPIQRLEALYRTIVRQLPEQPGDLLELTAGFCYRTKLRMEVHNDAGTSKATPSVATLLQMLGMEVEKQPEVFKAAERYDDLYLAEERSILRHRVFFETSAGHFGLGPQGVKDGDIICKIYGVYWPFILRKVDSHYVIVGSCWVLGFMGGQGLDESQSEMIEIW